MKRSKMIELIYSKLQDNHFGQYGEFYKMAEDILNSVEDNCVLFPCTGKDDDSILMTWEKE